jgi:hypothetical protein
MPAARVTGDRTKPADIAQAGAITGAIFAALLAADPLEIRTRASWVRYFDYLAFALWIAAVVLFVLVVAAPDRSGLRSRDGELRVGIPALVTALAGGLTVVALILSVTHWSADTDTVALALTRRTRAAIDRLCGTAGKRPLRGKIETATLRDQVITITLTPKTPNGCDQVRIQASSIIAFREHPRN